MSRYAVLLVIAACGHASENTPASARPAETVAVTPEPAQAASASSTPASTPSSAPSQPASAQPSPPPAPTLDQATCAKNAPLRPRCKWTVEPKPRCSGAALRPAESQPPAELLCVCNGCEADSDCKAKRGGTCATFGRVCGPQAKACVYP